ncbi:acyl dehydratase, partial [Mycolicibacterium elephantis]
NGNGVVDIEFRATSQRGEITAPATATVALPSRELGPVVLPEPDEELRRKAVAFMARHNELSGRKR